MVEVRPLKLTPIPSGIVANTTHNTILFAHTLHDDLVVICLKRYIAKAYYHYYTQQQDSYCRPRCSVSGR